MKFRRMMHRNFLNEAGATGPVFLCFEANLP